MSFWKTKSSTKCPFNISYQYHKPESGKLVLYNVSGKTVRNIHMLVVGDEKQQLQIDIPELLYKTSHLIDYSELTKLTDKTSIKRVALAEVMCTGKKFCFKPNETNKFELV